MLTQERRETLRHLTVDVILEARRDYLRSGASALRHWDQLQDRMRAAARTCRDPREWVTRLRRDLQLGPPDPASSRSCELLVQAVGGPRETREWLDLVEREHGYLMALARLRAEEMKRR